MKIRIKPGKRSKLFEFLMWDFQVTRDQEPGTLRLEFFEDPSDENVVYLYKAYRDQAAIEEHRSLPPYKQSYDDVMTECLESVDRVLEWSEATWSLEHQREIRKA
jgi:quinol monooxygenase YgiN